MDAVQRVWVVCDAFNYEGYGKPLAVFSTGEAARGYAAEVMKQTHPPDWADVFEMVVDVAEPIDA